MERIEIADRARLAHNRALKAYGLPYDEDCERKTTVMDGLATAYDKPYLHDGIIRMFAPGAFKKCLASGKPIGFCLDHDITNIFATTRDALELFEDEGGLAFRLDLSQVDRGGILARMSEIDNRPAMSVSYQTQRFENRTYGGHEVCVVLEANLFEISMCRAGKVGTAFNFLTDAARYPKPQAGYRSNDFAVSHALFRVKRATANNSR